MVSSALTTAICKCGAPAEFGLVRVPLAGVEILVALTRDKVIWPPGAYIKDGTRHAELDRAVREAWLRQLAASWDISL